jgi:hypothetical protein
MRLLITENKLKSFISKRLGVDLSNKIQMITSYNELPDKFKIFIKRVDINEYLNSDGPMFLFSTENGEYLYQNWKYGSMIIDYRGTEINDSKLLELLGVDMLGINIEELIKLYFEE